MKKFDHGCEANRAAILAARIARGKEQERGTQALSAAAQQISGDFRDRWKRSLALPREFFFDENEVFADEIENLFGRQQSDGLSPKSVLFPVSRSREPRGLGETEKASEVPCCGRGDFF